MSVREAVRRRGPAVASSVLALAGVVAAAPLASQQATPAPLAAAEASSVAAPQAAGAEAAPLTLERAIELGLERNRTLEQARLGLHAARERVDEAWGAVWPSVNVSSTYTRNLDVPVNFLPARIFDPGAGEDELVGVRFGSDNVWGLNLTAEQKLFDPAVFVGVGAAARYEALQEESVRGVAQQTVTEIRVAYYDVLLAQEAARLREQSLERIRRTLEETRALNRAGLAADYDVLRLEVEQANVEPTVRQAENQLAAARRGLGVLLGVDRADTLRVDGAWPVIGVEAVAGAAETGARLVAAVPPALPPAEELVRLARASRSDLRQLALERDLRRTELRLEQSEFLPKISLFGTYSINAQDNGSPSFFGGDDGVRAYGQQVGVRVTLPLFSGFQRPARMEQKEAALAQVDARYRLALDQAESQVRTLADAVEEAAARAAAQRRAVAQAERGYDIARASYREGLGSRLEVTDAELALRQSEFNAAQAVYDYLIARARLDAALGAVPFVDTGAASTPQN